jgi:hypothetical protein
LRASSPTFGNVPGDFLGPELGVTGGDFELLDVDRGKDVILEEAFEIRIASSKL